VARGMFSLFVLGLGLDAFDGLKVLQLPKYDGRMLSTSENTCSSVALPIFFSIIPSIFLIPLLTNCKNPLLLLPIPPFAAES